MSDRRDRFQGSTKQSMTWGVVGFAGIMLLWIGVLQLLQGISALAKDEFLLAGPDYVYTFSLTTWGWLQLALGIIAIAVAVGILAGSTLARMGAIVIATLITLAQFAFLPYYPLWSLVLIAFSVLVIWAVATQGLNDD